MAGAEPGGGERLRSPQRAGGERRRGVLQPHRAGNAPTDAASDWTRAGLTTILSLKLVMPKTDFQLFKVGMEALPWKPRGPRTLTLSYASAAVEDQRLALL